jgi:outer membrane protein assembly factor BamB
MSRNTRSVVAVFLFTAWLTSAAVAQWQVGVGGVPARHGQSAEVGPHSPTTLWSGPSGTTVSQQHVVDQGIVVTNRMFNIGDPINGTDIEARDLLTGALLWDVQVLASFGDSWRSRVTGFRDGQVYVTRSGNTNAEYLYALDPADGSIIWTSVDLMTETSTESVCFAPNGDIITSGVATAGARLIRIDKDDGTTVWTTPGTCPTSGGCDPVVFGNRVYMFEASASGPKITAVDLATGAKLYSGPGIVGGFIQQVAPFVGPDGTVYAPRTQNNPLTDFLVAYDDTGAALVEKWRTPLGFCAFASFGVGPDGSVYSYSANKEVLRLDPANGNVTGTSPPIPADSFHPRVAIGADGTLYLTNGAFSNGALFAYTPDLDLLWSVPLTNVNVGGPALADGGILVVGGTQKTINTYRCAAYFDAYGAGCAGSGGFTPSLSGLGCPAPGETVTLELDGALGGTTGFLFFGAGTGIQPVLGCDLQILPLLPLNFGLPLGGAGPGNGGFSLPGLIPPTTPPVDLYLQVMVPDPGSAGGAAGSNPLQMHIE